MRQPSNYSRREFFWRTALLGGAAAAPAMFPQYMLGGQRRPGANDRIVVGVIGVGNRGNLLIDQLPAPGHIAAICDCDLQRCEQAVGVTPAAGLPIGVRMVWTRSNGRSGWIEAVRWSSGLWPAVPRARLPSGMPTASSNGVEVHLDLESPDEMMGGGRFIGEKGSIDIWRNTFKLDAPGVAPLASTGSHEALARLRCEPQDTERRH